MGKIDIFRNGPVTFRKASLRIVQATASTRSETETVHSLKWG